VDSFDKACEGFRADLDQLVLQGRQRPVLDRLRRRQRAQEIAEVVGERMKLESYRVGGERSARQSRPLELAQVNDLATQGKSQSEIADRTRRGGARIAELQLENSRLRQRAIDLMRKIIKREEAAQSQIRRVRGMS
jgi:hypothetical protein